MDIHEVAQEKWADFLDKFSKDHAGRHVTVEAYGPGTNPHTESRALPFVGVTYEPKSQDIEIQLGMEAKNHVSHTVTKPTHVWVRTHTEEGGDILEIRSADGVMILLRLAPAD